MGDRVGAGQSTAQAIFEPNPFPYNNPTFSKLIRSSHTYLPMKMEETECSETSAYNIQTSGNYPEKSIGYRENYLALVEHRQMSAGNDAKERRNMWMFLG